MGWLVARLPPDNMDNKITVEMGIYPPNMFVGGRRNDYEAFAHEFSC